jgi:hypothetical protein
VARDPLPEFRAGDIILFAGRDDWYGRLSRWGMRTAGESPTYAVHTAQFIAADRYLELDIVGKLRTTGEILRPRQVHDTWQRRGFEVWRCLVLTGAQQEALTQQALAYLGARFSCAKFLTHLLDGLINKGLGREVFVFRRLNHDQRYPICSWITAFSYDRALHYQFGVPPSVRIPIRLTIGCGRTRTNGCACSDLNTPSWWIRGVEARAGARAAAPSPVSAAQSECDPCSGAVEAPTPAVVGARPSL